MTVLSRFGENLRWHREQAGLSQEELADLIGIHRTAVSAYERGRQEPRLELLVKAADSLEVAIGELFDGISWKPDLPGQKQPAAGFEIAPPDPDPPDA
jgi:transcriptional regulator with XRE-family HTH domain